MAIFKIENNNVYVGPSTVCDSSGVFAKKFLPEGSIIERCPLIFFNSKKMKDDCELVYYRFSWNDDIKCIALGYGSIYNHSYTPNARYYRLTDEEYGDGILFLEFQAIKDIHPGEEILVNYNGDPFEKKEVPHLSFHPLRPI